MNTEQERLRRNAFGSSRTKPLSPTLKNNYNEGPPEPSDTYKMYAGMKNDIRNAFDVGGTYLQNKIMPGFNRMNQRIENSLTSLPGRVYSSIVGPEPTYRAVKDQPKQRASVPGNQPGVPQTTAPTTAILPGNQPGVPQTTAPTTAIPSAALGDGQDAAALYDDAQKMMYSQYMSKDFNPVQQRMANDYFAALQKQNGDILPGDAALQAAGMITTAGDQYSNYKYNPPSQPAQQAMASLPTSPANGQPAANALTPNNPYGQGTMHPGMLSVPSTLQNAQLPPQNMQNGMNEGYAQRELSRINTYPGAVAQPGNNGINFAPQGYGSAASLPQKPEAGTKAYYDAMGPAQRELLSAVQKLNSMSTNPMDGPSSLVKNKDGGYDRVVTGLAEQQAKVNALREAAGGMGSLRGAQLPNEVADRRTIAGERTARLQTGQLADQAAMEYALGQEELNQNRDKTQMMHAKNLAAQRWAQSPNNPANFPPIQKIPALPNQKIGDITTQLPDGFYSWPQGKQDQWWQKMIGYSTQLNALPQIQ